MDASETITLHVQDVPLQVLTLTDQPDPFTPNGDGINDTTTISGTFDRSVNWRSVITVIDNGPSRIYSFTGPATSVSAVWDGRDQAGVLQPTGTYTYFVVGLLTSTGEQAQRSGTVTLARPTGGGGDKPLSRTSGPRTPLPQ